ncbi:6-pyruvoyl-tetrahydropterin synthase-related protein [uncultured Methanobacterium sp.]|uniref:6-pyruvoyl-tetrahydropterin synthase-related protein n=1 Tax=uncultured Methanobacterium sp. TaxID=176306 RepID=UPI002AA9248E|nr:6-pyruvoyl-tetrahydropterin synthase-related protein [uncultured Methanobacterium sp.]
MNCPQILREKPVLLLLIPALAAFFIALIPTLKYQWPLGGDIFYHVHLAKLYMEQGLVYWDPLTSAPYGRPIFYPPVFHLLLLSVGLIFGDMFTAARVLQPVLTLFLFLSFAYVAYKLYESVLVGVTAGFFIFFSVVFQRFILPGPENLALILFPLVIYGFYLSTKNKSYKYASISGIIAGVVFLTHMLSASFLVLVTSIYAILISLKDKSILKYWLVFLVSTLLVASIWWAPLLLKYGLVFNSGGDSPYMVSLLSYPKFFGVLTLLFAFLGAIGMIKRRSRQDILILISLISILLVSNLNYLGIPILSNRFLTFALFPLVVMAGVGVNYLKTVIAEKNISQKFYGIFIACVYVSSVMIGYSMLADVDSGFLWLRASDGELDIAEWFQENGDKKSVVVAYNFRDPFIVAISRQPVATGGYGQGIVHTLDIQKYADGGMNQSDYINDNVGYVVLPSGMNAPPYTTLAYKNNYYQIFTFNK